MKTPPAKPAGTSDVSRRAKHKSPRLLLVTAKTIPSPGLIQGLCANRFITEAGWNSENVAGLMRSIQIVLRNFEILTGEKLRPKVVVSAQPPMEKGAMIESYPHSKGGVFQVFLRHEPALVAEYAPFGLAQRLTEIIFDKNSGLAIFTDGPEGFDGTIAQYMEKATGVLADYYLAERGIVLFKQTVNEHFMALINDCMTYLKTNKTAFHLLRPLPIPQRPIQAGIQNALDLLKDKLEQGPQLHAWEYIMKLAGFSVIASKVRCPAIELECSRFVTNEFGDKLVDLEQLQLRLAPANRAKALVGFQLLFEKFRSIADYYYDYLEIE